jgi:hypothetical protein
MALGPRFGHGAGQPEDSGPDRRQPGGPAKRQAGWRQHWLSRQVRGIRPDRNPLRRRTDRVETFLLAALFTASAASAPFLVDLASHAAARGAQHTRQEQLLTHHKMQAYLTQPAGSGLGGGPPGANVPAYASWTTPAGQHRTGVVPAQVGSLKGAAVTVYTDSAGNLTTPPLSVAEVANEADAAAVGAAVGIVVVTVAGAAGIRQVLFRRRMADWAADWAVTARTWNPQSW